MPRPAVQDNSRVWLRIRTVDKAKIIRASATANTGITEFIINSAVEAADRVIEKHERALLSEGYFARAMELLEYPPAPKAKMRRAIEAMPRL